MRRTTSRLACAVALSASLVAAGCGNGTSTPKNPHDELVAGLSALSKSDVLTTTLKLDTTPTQLQQIAQLSGSTLSTQAAQGIASAQLVIESKRGDAQHKAFSVRAVDGGTTLVELRYVAKSLYLQANVQSILQLANKPNALQSIQSQASQLPPFLTALLGGKWVSLSSETLSAIGGQLGASGSTSSSNNAKLLADLQSAFRKDVTAKKVGSDSKGDHLTLTADGKTVLTDFVTAVQNDVPTASTLTGRFQPSKIPSRNITLDAWVKDGAVSEIELDLAQFAPPGKAPSGTHLPIVLAFDKSGSDITAPSGATAVDLSQLGSLFGALQGGSGSLGG